MLAKSKAQDARDRALYESQKIQSAQIQDIIDYLIQDPEKRGRFFRRKSLTRLEEEAFRDYDDEHTGFS